MNVFSFISFEDFRLQFKILNLVFSKFESEFKIAKKSISQLPTLNYKTLVILNVEYSFQNFLLLWLTSWCKNLVLSSYPR